jgi:hypothetical protein
MLQVDPKDARKIIAIYNAPVNDGLSSRDAMKKTTSALGVKDENVIWSFVVDNNLSDESIVSIITVA